jgi:hypothetical protein
VEGEDVDRSALAADVERHFGGDLPTRGAQESDHPLDETRVAFVEEPVESFTLPEQSNVDPSSQGSGDRDERVQGDPVRPTTLDPPDDRPRHTSHLGEPTLRPAPPPTESPDPETKPDDVHGWSMTVDAALAVTRASARSSVTATSRLAE